MPLLRKGAGALVGDEGVGFYRLGQVHPQVGHGRDVEIGGAVQGSSRAADFKRDELLGVLHHGVSAGIQHPGAFVGCHLAPLPALESCASGSHRAVHIGGIAHGGAAHAVTGGRVDNVGVMAGSGFGTLAVYDQGVRGYIGHLHLLALSPGS